MFSMKIVANSVVASYYQCLLVRKESTCISWRYSVHRVTGCEFLFLSWSWSFVSRVEGQAFTFSGPEFCPHQQSNQGYHVTSDILPPHFFLKKKALDSPPLQDWFLFHYFVLWIQHLVTCFLSPTFLFRRHVTGEKTIICCQSFCTGVNSWRDLPLSR